jgi:hypothetical protein
MGNELDRSANWLLRLMPVDDFQALSPYLENASLPLRTPLETAGLPIQFAYFFESGLASIVARKATGADAEVGQWSVSKA